MNRLINIGYIVLILLFFGCEEEKIDIDKFGVIAGKIIDGETYEPISGVQIVTNPASSTALTTNEGKFQFDKVKEGDVAITARKKDYLSSSVSIAVYEKETTDLVFFLLKDENNVGWITIYDPVPGNGAVDQDISFTFQWNVDQENKGKELEYTVYYFESNSTVQKVAGENLNATEVVVSGLEFSTTYYWYVVAKHEGSRVANSPTWTYRTKADS